MNVTIRAAAPGDAAALAAIYAPYVEKTAITFEYTAPTAQEFAGRIEHTLAKYPYLVAEGDGEILGYAYAGVFKGRTAYDWTAEVSIYLREDRRRAGLGSLLYDALEQCLVRQNIKTLIAAITSDRNISIRYFLIRFSTRRRIAPFSFCSAMGCHLLRELGVVDLLIGRALCQQFLMSALSHQFAVIQHQNQIRIPHRGRPLGDDERGRRLGHIANSHPQTGIGGVIQCGSTVVHNQNLRLANQRAGNGQSLPLTAGEVRASLLHRFVQHPGFALHHILSLGNAKGLPKVFVGGIFVAP